MTVHEAAARGFARSADAYERARPGYPLAALDWLAERLGLRAGRTVVDVAAGTGKLTRLLVAKGARVVAVEPVDEMRALVAPPAQVLAGTAEDLPLPDAGADAATVAQAFHWFDGDRALAELHRVLRPGGHLALVWNRRRLEDPLQAALEELLAPVRGDVPAHRSDRWRAAFARTQRFGPLEERDFPHAQALDAGGLADRIGSISFVAAADDATRAELLARVQALVPAKGGTVTLRYLCAVQVAERRA